MKISRFDFPDVFELRPTIFADSRGYFQVPYDQRVFEKEGLPTNFVQDNESFSIAGTLRGLHFQKGFHAQGKLVRVISGEVQDVIVDLRHGSPTFKQWKSFYISSEESNILYVPPGFAHGFLALSDTIFSYKCTSLYEKSAEGGIRWDDPELAITWDLTGEPVVSDKDQQLSSLMEALQDSSFTF